MAHIKKMVIAFFLMVVLVSNSHAMINCALGVDCIFGNYEDEIFIPIDEKGDYECHIKRKIPDDLDKNAFDNKRDVYYRVDIESCTGNNDDQLHCLRSCKNKTKAIGSVELYKDNYHGVVYFSSEKVPYKGYFNARITSYTVNHRSIRDYFKAEILINCIKTNGK